MKARTCFASEVVEADAFLGLDVEAQLLYFHICCESRPSGLIVGASRIVRGYGFTLDVLDELTKAGYLLNVDGQLFITHTWCNNSYDSRLFTNAMASCEPYQSGRLGFAGEVGKSRYVLIDEKSTFERRSSDCEEKGSEGNGSDLSLNGLETNVHGRGGMQGGGTNKHPCLCKRCNAQATYTTEGGQTVIECPNCGSYKHHQ